MMKRKVWIYVIEAAFVMFIAMIFAPTEANAQYYQNRRDIREGAYEINQERREARREILTADSPMEVRHEIREGRREVTRERVEARRDIRRNYY